jgi:hypothetical protein
MKALKLYKLLEKPGVFLVLATILIKNNVFEPEKAYFLA